MLICLFVCMIFCRLFLHSMEYGQVSDFFLHLRVVFRMLNGRFTTLKVNHLDYGLIKKLISFFKCTKNCFPFFIMIMYYVTHGTDYEFAVIFAKIFVYTLILVLNHKMVYGKIKRQVYV